MAVTAKTIKVDIQKLRSTSSELRAEGNKIADLTGEMKRIVSELSGEVWSGDAASKYTGQFNKLQDDIERMRKMINEHEKDLTNMANLYEKAENSNAAIAGSLAGDVIV